MLTIENFGPDNRTKTVGHSMYRICNTDRSGGTGKWYIHETYNDGKEWAQNNSFYRNSLEEIIDIFNLLDEEKKVVSLGLSGNKTYAPMSVEDAYQYYWHVYKTGIYSLLQLQIKHRDAEQHRPEWKSHRDESIYGARDYETYNNMQRALRMVIKEIIQSNFRFNPKPESVDMLDLEMEEKKITIAHRTLHITCRRSLLHSGDTFYHNLRASLINRIEDASNGILIVDLDGADANSIAKIRDRKEYLKEKYGSCQSDLCPSCNIKNCNDKPDWLR